MRSSEGSSHKDKLGLCRGQTLLEDLVCRDRRVCKENQLKQRSSRSSSLQPVSKVLTGLLQATLGTGASRAVNDTGTLRSALAQLHCSDRKGFSFCFPLFLIVRMEREKKKERKKSIQVEIERTCVQRRSALNLES